MLNSILSDSVTLSSFVVCLVASLALGVLNALVFSWKSRTSASFSLTLSLLPMVIAVVIMLVNGNIGTGVAVAGAFALIRFRSVPGTAREIAAIFVDMAMGLAIGMGYVGIAAVFFVFAAAVTLLLTRIGFGGPSGAEKQLRITIPENFDYEGLFDEVFKKFTAKCDLEKIRTTNMGTLFELTYRVTFAENKIPVEFVNELRARNGNLTVMVGDFSDREEL